ncbi:unnamed protein product [Clonostachys solani]|uniref:DUF7728 domain-containing protein n=1 Tax=Clonostachys solani TaxID=160281 RepID=A0A9N9W1A8_9HYPO|nr:unnamed protein product [Clonostachys solani]
MLLKQLALAASAAAFLVVPDLPGKEVGQDEEVKTLPVVAKPNEAPGVYVIPQFETVSVPCAECKGSSDSHIKLDFQVENAARLTVNGYELYPTADPWHNDLVASEVADDGKAADQTLGYALAVAPRVEDPFIELITVDLRIIEVGELFVEKVPAVRVNLLKMRQGGEIFLNNIEIAHVIEVEDSIASRIKAKFASLWGKIKSLGKCKHHKGMHHKGMGHKGHKDHKGHKGHKEHKDHEHHHGKVQGHGGDHHHHGHRGFRRDWRKLLKNITTNILLPVLTGITAGVGVAVLAMGLCSVGAVVFASRRRRHRRCSRRSKHAARPQPPPADDEKARLMEHYEDLEAAPPHYQDHPAQEAQVAQEEA